jgi:hypothetical protein
LQQSISIITSKKINYTILRILANKQHNGRRYYLSAAMCLVATFVLMLRGKQNTVLRGAVSENILADTTKQQVAAASDID